MDHDRAHTQRRLTRASDELARCRQRMTVGLDWPKLLSNSSLFGDARVK